MEKHISLIGIDGNAMNIMAHVTSYMKYRFGFTPDDKDKYIAEAMSKDYDHLLQVSLKYCDLINERIDMYNNDEYAYSS